MLRVHDHDLIRVCVDCDAEYTLTVADQQRFADLHLALPKRCRACRRARRLMRLQHEAIEAT